MLELTTDGAQPFVFLVDGERYEVPRFDSLPADEVLELYKKQRAALVEGGTDAANEVAEDYIRALFDKHAPGVCERLSLAAYKMLLEAYTETASAPMGESLA